MFCREDFDNYLQQVADDRRRNEEDRVNMENLLEEVNSHVLFSLKVNKDFYIHPSSKAA